MNKRTIKIKYRHIPRPTTDSAEQQKQLAQRSAAVNLARQLYPKIIDPEEAYAAFCREHNVEHITLDMVHHAAVDAREAKKKKHAIKLFCPECREFTVTVDALCPSCEEFRKGNLSSLFCSKCLLTTYSPKGVESLLSGLGLQDGGNM